MDVTDIVSSSLFHAEINLDDLFQNENFNPPPPPPPPPGLEEFKARNRLIILRQPAENQHRFRYLSEKRATGTILAKTENSGDKQTRIYPAVALEGDFKGEAWVEVSCVDENLRVHPNNVMYKGKMYIKHRINFDSDKKAILKSLGIITVKKDEIKNKLKEKQAENHDPFQKGYDFNSRPDMSKVRLCLQAFLNHPTFGIVALDPVASDLVKDKKIYNNLDIIDISEDRVPANGGKKVLLFTSRVSKEDIRIVFDFKVNDRNESVSVDPDHVHEHHGIRIFTPNVENYFTASLTPIREIKAKLRLVKPSGIDDASDPRDFTFYLEKQLPQKREIPKPDDGGLSAGSIAVPPSRLRPNEVPVILEQNVPIESSSGRFCLEILGGKAPLVPQIVLDASAPSTPHDLKIPTGPDNFIEKFISVNSKPCSTNYATIESPEELNTAKVIQDTMDMQDENEKLSNLNLNKP